MQQLGVPMRVHSRIQINLLMDTTKFNSRTKPYDNIVLPVVWMEIAVERLTPNLLLLLHMLFNVLPYVQAGFVCLLCVVGVSLYAIAALLYLCSPSNVATNTYEKNCTSPRSNIR